MLEKAGTLLGLCCTREDPETRPGVNTVFAWFTLNCLEESVEGESMRESMSQSRNECKNESKESV